MEYATSYDVGDRKRSGGINEDSVAVATFEDGHRDGFRGHRVDGPGADAESDERSVESRDDERATRSAAVFALADGAGGHDAGDVASYVATTVVPERLAEVAIRQARSDPAAFDVDLDEPLPTRRSPAELRAAVAEAIADAHREILRYAETAGQGAYTTIVAGIAVDGALHYGWVGDSRAYVCNRAHGEISRLTADHTVVADLERAGRVDPVEARVHPRGNEITRALGGRPGSDPGTATVEVDTNSIALYAEDVVLVTSDGLIDAQTDAPDLYERYVDADGTDVAADEIREAVVTDDEIGECVLSAETLSAAATDLVDLGNDRGGKDNLSTLLFADGSLPATPDEPPTRGIRGDGPIEDRETRLLPGE